MRGVDEPHPSTPGLVFFMCLCVCVCVCVGVWVCVFASGVRIGFRTAADVSQVQVGAPLTTTNGRQCSDWLSEPPVSMLETATPTHTQKEQIHNIEKDSSSQSPVPWLYLVFLVLLGFTVFY